LKSINLVAALTLGTFSASTLAEANLNPTCSMNYTNGASDGYKCRGMQGDSDFVWAFHNAGLRESDILLSVDGEPLSNVEAMGRGLQKISAAKFKEVIVRREGKEMVMRPDPHGPAHY
jgi:hypothetical protein